MTVHAVSEPFLSTAPGNSGWYERPIKSLPGKVSTSSQWWRMTSLNSSFARISSSPISAPPWPSHFSGTAVTRTRTYSTSGPTARPTLPGSVQGVVVQARIEASVSSNLNLTYTDGSSTSLYPRATSWLEYEVPVCGQYGRTL